MPSGDFFLALRKQLQKFKNDSQWSEWWAEDFGKTKATKSHCHELFQFRGICG